jgi:tetratricopeptide (TPR) repeat protein
MGEDRPLPRSPEALLEQALAGGQGAALAARRAAVLAERENPELALKALALVARLEPLDPAPRLAAARLHAEQGNVAAAQAEATTVLREAVDEAARARAAFMLGEMARMDGDHTAARGHYQLVMQIEDQLLAGNRGDPTAARWYARARGRTAELDASAGAFDRARAGAEGALAMLRATAAQIGETPALAADIADAELRLGALELDSNEADSARRRFAEAIGRYEALAVTEKDEPHWRAVLADTWALAAEAEYMRGRAEKAREAMDLALAARIRLAARDPDEAWGLAGLWRIRAALRAALNDTDAATDSLAQARALTETLAARAGHTEMPTRFFVRTLVDQADHALRSGDLNLAREAADTARMEAERFAAKPEALAIWVSDAASCWDRLGEVARAAQASDKAHDAFARAVEFRRLALEREANNEAASRALGGALLKLGEAALQTGAVQSARAAFHESLDIRLRFLDATPDDPGALLNVAAALERLGLATFAEGDRTSARNAWEEELMLAARIFSDRDSLEAIRFRAIVEAHLTSVGGPNSEAHRLSALQGFDALAKAGVLTPREAALRKKLWGA